MVYVDFEDSAILKLFCFAQYAFYRDGVVLRFCVDYIFDLALAVEKNVEFTHAGFHRFE